MENNFSNEDEFICLCSRLAPGPKEFSRIKQNLLKPLNWDYVLQQIKEQGVATLFFHTLSDLGLRLEGIIPEEAISKLRNTYYLVGERNARNYQNLKELLLRLNQEGIEVIILKGLVLAELVYKNPALRQMVDVDFLVKKEDFNRLRKLLLNYGYKQSYAGQGWSGLLERFGGEMYFFKGDLPFLDIHHSLCQYERFKGIIKIDQGIWQRRQRISLFGVPIAILSPGDMILHLCLHSSLAHFFHKLSLFCDLRESVIYFRGQIDWDDFIKRAKDYRLSIIVYESLRLAQELLGDFVDPDILKRLKPNWLRRFFLDLSLRDKAASLDNLGDERRKYLFQLLSLDSICDIPRLILSIAFPSSDWLQYRYAINNRRLLCFYRFLHPFLIFKAFFQGRMVLRF